MSGWWNSQFIVRALGGGIRSYDNLTNANFKASSDKVYYDFKSKQLQEWNTSKSPNTNVPADKGKVLILLDPMGNPYGYNPLNPIFNPETYDLWSAGTGGRSYYPDKYSVSNENIGNWGR